VNEPRIEYAKTSDGVSIAYWSLGEGIPFIHMPNPPWSHGTVARRVPEMRRWFQCLLSRRRMVRYDPRGCGLSERDAEDFSLDALTSDLECVVDALDLEKFALFAYFSSGPVAVNYVVRHPERVSHLILWCSYARGSDYTGSRPVEATRLLLDSDWEIYTETAAHVLLGWAQGEEARRLAEYMREAVEPETARALFTAIEGFDVTPLLSQIRCPTLVLHRRQVPWATDRVPKEIAAGVPGASLVLLDGTSPVPGLGNMNAVLGAIGEFLGCEFEQPEPEAAPVHTILFTDVEGSTALTERLGDASAREVMREHERITRDALRAHGGSEVKTMGDGFMASFGSATKALECAIAIQKAFAEPTSSLPARPEVSKERAVDGAPIRVRCGLNAGEPIAEDDDLFGTAVIVAARIAAQAQGGEILVSDVVRQLVAGKGFLFNDRGEHALKGFEDPVRMFEVSWRENADG
jgi:class 3 adenylate cyclase/pimeloyl-ACP methyl ester carboxylesterase